VRFDFSGQTVLVTGAAHGFGRAIAGAFGVRGANVYVCDVIEHELAGTVDIVGERCRGAVVDVTDRQAVGAWVEGARAETERIDVLVNNAGGVLGQIGRPIEQVSMDDWEAILGALGWLTHAPVLGQTVHGLGVVVMVGASIWGAFALAAEWRRGAPRAEA